MDNTKLENMLKEQKIPFEQAVQKKMAYLKSDDVFLTEGDDYISIFKSYTQAQKINSDNSNLEAAFQSLMSSSETKSMTQNVSEAASSRPIGQPNSVGGEQKMSIAQRIAALRGIINVPPEYRR